MRFFRRRRQPPPPPPSFGEWALRSFAKDQPTEGMTFAELEQLCSNAASLLVGAAYAEPALARSLAAEDPGTMNEAEVLARRTADGFRAALADRDNTVLAWPWDHLGTRVAWEATRGRGAAESAIGDALWRVAVAYALRYREQVGHVLTLWEQVAAAVAMRSKRPSLESLGREALRAYQELTSSA